MFEWQFGVYDSWSFLSLALLVLCRLLCKLIVTMERSEASVNVSLVRDLIFLPASPQNLYDGCLETLLDCVSALTVLRTMFSGIQCRFKPLFLSGMFY